MRYQRNDVHRTSVEILYGASRGKKKKTTHPNIGLDFRPLIHQFMIDVGIYDVNPFPSNKLLLLILLGFFFRFYLNGFFKKHCVTQYSVEKNSGPAIEK